MRFTKELAVILVLVSLYYWDVRPRMEDYPAASQQLVLLKKQLRREQLFADQHAEIAKAVEASLAMDKANAIQVYTSDIPSSTVFSQLQELINQIIQKNGLQMVNLRWGEPFRNGKSAFSGLPVSVMAQGSPPQIFGFLKDIQSAEKAFSFPIFTITRGTQDTLILDVTVVAYQLVQEGK